MLKKVKRMRKIKNVRQGKKRKRLARSKGTTPKFPIHLEGEKK